MRSSSSPTVRRRRLGSELRRLREEAGRTIDEVARSIGCSRNTVGKYESGRGSVRAPYVRAMLDLYDVPADLRDVLLTIARESRQKGWWTAYEDVLPAGFEIYVGLEAEAASLRVYEAQLVHGLLQTEDYARAMLRAMPFLAGRAAEVERLVALRMARQSLISRPAPFHLWVILDESVLRRPLGGAKVMQHQIRHLTEMCEMPNISVQVLPFSMGGHAGLDGAFSIMEFPEPEDPDVVYLEGRAGNVYVEAAEDVRRYTLIFDHLGAAALPPGESAGFLRSAAKETA